ncbi:hypothetical protein RAA17_01835 [Komagataeibacter rhaeticus]|nr:hypothetical protein [Komagataeibacter rhaeticus]
MAFLPARAIPSWRSRTMWDSAVRLPRPARRHMGWVMTPTVPFPLPPAWGPVSCPC